MYPSLLGVKNDSMFFLFISARLEVELVWEFVKDILKKLKDMLFLSDSRGLIGLSSRCEVPNFRMVLNLWHGWCRENDHRWRCFQQCFKYFLRQEFCGKVLGKNLKKMGGLVHVGDSVVFKENL